MKRRLSFFFKLKPSIPYPSEDIRTKVMRPYIFEVFGEFFELVLIEWLKKDGKLEGIVVSCESLKILYDEKTEFLFITFILSSATLRLNILFSQFGTRIGEIDVAELVPTLAEHAANITLARFGKAEFSFNNTFRPFFVERNFEGYLEVRFKQPGRAELEAKNLLKILRELNLGVFRINPKERGIIEIKDKKSGKWRPIYIFRDPTYYARELRDLAKALLVLIGCLACVLMLTVVYEFSKALTVVFSFLPFFLIFYAFLSFRKKKKL